jgi:hypothetical protein
VGSTETLADGQLGLGLATTYLSRPIVLHVPSPGGPGTDQPVADNQVDSSFLWSYGVSDRLEVDLVLPLTVVQNGSGLAPITGGPELEHTAVRDMRFGVAYALLQPGPFGLAARFEMSAPTGDRDELAGERSAVAIPGLAADYRHGPFLAAVEVSSRLRPATSLLGASVGSQFVPAAGLSYDLLPRELLSATVEAWGLFPLDGAEWQASLRMAPLCSANLSIQGGGGGPIVFGDSAPITIPRYRFALSVRWAPHGRGGPCPASTAPEPSTQKPDEPDGGAALPVGVSR